MILCDNSFSMTLCDNSFSMTLCDNSFSMTVWHLILNDKLYVLYLDSI